MTSEDEISDLARLQDEWEAARHGLDIFSKADNHLKENVSTFENYGTGDAIQFMVSTDGTIIHGKNRGVGWRTRQLGGHVDSASLRQVSQDMTTMTIRTIGDEGPPPRGRTPPAPGNGAENEPAPEFRGRYGRGFTLTPKSSTNPVENEQQNSAPNR